MQSRRIAPPLDLRAEIKSGDQPDDKALTSTRPSLQLKPAPASKGPPKQLVLKRIYRQFPKLKLNQLVAKAIIQQPKLKLREAEEYFKLRRQQDSIAKEKDPKRRKTRKDKKSNADRVLFFSDEQHKLLEDVFYRQHRGTLGVRALWEILKEHPDQKAALSKDSKHPQGIVSWRDVRAWHAAQETVQRHARANKRSKTLVNLPTEEQMKPFVRFQLDTIVMAQGNNKTDDDSAWKPGQSLTDTKDKRGLPDNGMRVHQLFVPGSRA
eukprot:COSAG02_NODE_8575_length_2517_cov_1.961125_2_plen_266_part_00